MDLEEANFDIGKSGRFDGITKFLFKARKSFSRWWLSGVLLHPEKPEGLRRRCNLLLKVGERLRSVLAVRLAIAPNAIAERARWNARGLQLIAGRGRTTPAGAHRRKELPRRKPGGRRYRSAWRDRRGF